MGFRAIERILGVSHVSVMNWVKKLGKSIEQMKKNYHTEFKVVEMDELCSYIKEKKTKYGFGALIVEIENKFLVFM
jgi:transposase-like protein